LANRIVKTADKIASLRAKMDSLRDAKIPTQEYKKLQNDIEKATSKLKQLKLQQASLKSSGNMFSDDWKKVSEQAQEASANIHNIKQEMDALKSAGTAVKQVPTEEYAELSRRLENAKAQLEGFATRQKEMKETGRDFMQGLAEQAQEASTNIQNIQKEMRSLESTGRTTTEEYTELQIHLGKWQEIQNNVASQQRAFAEEWKSLPDYIKHSTSVVRDLEQKMQALRDSGKATKTVPTEEYAQLQSQLQKWQENARAIEAEQEKLRQSGKQFTSEWNNSANKIREARAQISSISTAMKDLENKGKAFTAGSETEEYAQLERQLGYLQNDYEVLQQRQREVIARNRETVSSFRRLADVAKNALKKMIGSIGSLNKSVKSTNVSMKSALKTILKYGLGIRSVYVLINKFRTAVKEGFANLAQFSAPESLSMLKSSLTQLKNSLATAFAPILTTIAPLLKTLIDMISQAATYVGMFIATLTGASTFTKAIAVQEDYAASLNKTGSAAKKATEQ
ncbi:MAG: hypothetical protein K2K74_20025, partial [Lachnospiraceae bacterium]|nr:hypothetical protein [Lachnospiraceae bacterium]